MPIQPNPRPNTSGSNVGAPVQGHGAAADDRRIPPTLFEPQQTTVWARPVGVSPTHGEEVTAAVARRPSAAAVHPQIPAPPPYLAMWPPRPSYPSVAPVRGDRQRTRRWIVAGVVAGVVIVCTGLGIAIASRTDGSASPAVASAANVFGAVTNPSQAPPAATVPLSALPGLLLDPATINSIEGATDISLKSESSDNTSAYVGLDNDRPECGEVQGPALQVVLDNSGWIGVRTQALSDPDGSRHLIHNAAIYFPVANAANDFAARQAQAWAKCNGATLHISPPGEAPSIWLVGTAVSRDGMLSITNTQEGGGGWQCQRALTVRNNIVIDTRSCGDDRTDQATTIAARMAERLTIH